MENKESNDIFARHCTEKGFNIAGAFIEMEARIKTMYTVIDEMKEVIQGQAKWAEITDERLKKLEPTITIYSENDVKNMLNKR